MMIISKRLQALVLKRDWNEIEEISRQRKSPIGWEVCIFSLPLVLAIQFQSCM